MNKNQNPGGGELMVSPLGDYLPPDNSEMTGCLDENFLAGYVEETLTLAETRSVEAHLAGCNWCREQTLFASRFHEIPEENRALAPIAASPGFRVAIRQVLEQVERVFEESVVLAETAWSPRLVPVFRGGVQRAVVQESQVDIGPFHLSLRRIFSGPGAGLKLGLSKQRKPMADTQATFELNSGKQVIRQTDALGWMEVGGIQFDEIAAIWITAVA